MAQEKDEEIYQQEQQIIDKDRELKRAHQTLSGFAYTLDVSIDGRVYNTYHERSCLIIVPVLKNLFSAVSTHGHFRQLPRGPTSKWAHANLCTLCCVKYVVLMFKH